MLGDRPAIRPQPLGYSTQQQLPGPATVLDPAEPAAGPSEQLLEHRLPSTRVDADARGRQMIIVRSRNRP